MINTKETKKNVNQKRENQDNNNYKKKSKKNKKVKKVIATIVTVIIILFLIRLCENGFTRGGFIATLLGHNSKTVEKLGTIDILITGESQGLTDTILICSYNPKNQQAKLISIPRDTFIGKNQNKATANEKINTLYAKSPEKLLNKVNEITKKEIKYYINIDTKALREVVDSIGGVEFDVPIDMNYEDPTQELYIHLKKGYQHLNGDKAEQLVRFRHNSDGTSYPASYGDNDIGRMKTQREFLKEVAKKIKKKSIILNFFKYKNIFKKNVETNIEIKDIINYIPYALDFSLENLENKVLDGAPKKCNGVWLYIPK